MAAESGSERLCCNHMRSFLYLHWCPNFDRRRAPLRRTDVEQFVHTDNCPGCANARAGRKQVVDHSEQCRSRMEAILRTTTWGHERVERARDRFAQAAEETGVKEPQRKRHRPEGERERPLAPPASSNYREGGSNSSGSALPPPPAPPPLEPPPLEKRGLDPETEMTDATVEQQREPKRRKEHSEMPQAADSSSSIESSTDTEMGLVDMCTILSENSETESRCRGGPVTLDLTEWDFSKVDFRSRCRKLVENSKPLWLIGSPIDSVRTGQSVRAVLHLKFKCTLVGISFSHIPMPQTVGNSLQWQIS